ELHAFDVFSIVRDRAEIHSEFTPTTRLARLFGFGELGSELLLAEGLRRAQDSFKHLVGACQIDLVGVVTGTMIVLMNSGEEKQNGNILGIEGSMIAGTITVILELEFQS